MDGDNCQFAARAIHLKMLSMFCAPASDTLFASSLPGDHCAESMEHLRVLADFLVITKAKIIIFIFVPASITYQFHHVLFIFNHLQ